MLHILPVIPLFCPNVIKLYSSLFINTLDKVSLNIPFINIGQPWNFMLDRACPEPSAGAYMWHHVNKEFELSFGKS